MNNKQVLAIFLTGLGIIIVGGLVWWMWKGKPGETPVPTTNPDIRVDSLKSGDSVKSPLTITGAARGTWYFEASFPIDVIGKDGKVIAQGHAEAQGDWMTENFVPFKAIITFNVSTTQNGEIVLKKDNPSGLPQFDKQIRIPVTLTAPGNAQRTVKLFYYNANNDKDQSGNVMCSRQGLVAVERQIPFTNTPVQDAVRLLLRGELTQTERARGITTEFPLQGVELKGAASNGSVLTLEFTDPNNKTSGGACRAGVLWAQIEATAKQFPEIKEVKFKPAELFQP